MEVKKTNFIVEIHKGSLAPYILISCVAPLVAMTAGIYLQSINEIVATIISMTLLFVPVAYATYKMFFKPDEFRLSFNEGTVQFLKNKTVLASCADTDLDIKLLVDREDYLGEHCHLLDVIVRFPSGKKQKFRVDDKRVVIIGDMAPGSYTTTTAPSYQVQHLLN